MFPKLKGRFLFESFFENTIPRVTANIVNNYNTFIFTHLFSILFLLTLDTVYSSPSTNCTTLTNDAIIIFTIVLISTADFSSKIDHSRSTDYGRDVLSTMLNRNGY